MRSAFATVALLLALVGQLSSLAHLWVVQHEVCKEHGQLVDEDGEHCVVSLTPGEAIEAPALEVRDAHVLAPRVAAADPIALARTHNVLRVAPKTSPPAA